MLSEQQNPKTGLWPGLSSLGVTGVVSYFGNLGLLNKNIAGWDFGPISILLIGLGCFIASQNFFQYVYKREYLRTGTLQGIALSTIVSVVGLLLLDMSYSAYIKASAPTNSKSTHKYDPNFAHWELYPRVYYPTDRNFRLCAKVS